MKWKLPPFGILKRKRDSYMQRNFSFSTGATSVRRYMKLRRERLSSTIDEYISTVRRSVRRGIGKFLVSFRERITPNGAGVKGDILGAISLFGNQTIQTARRLSMSVNTASLWKNISGGILKRSKQCITKTVSETTTELRTWSLGRVSKIIVVALLVLIAIRVFGSEVVIVDTASYEQLQENTREYERVKEILNEKEKQENELRKKLYSFCDSQREPQVCKAIGEAGVEVQVSIGFQGLAKLAVSLGRSEQNYRCPVSSFNCFGLGAYDKYHYNRYSSYREAVLDLARLLRRYGYNKIAPEDIPAISRWYKGVPPYAHWIALIQEVMLEIG